MTQCFVLFFFFPSNFVGSSSTLTSVSSLESQRLTASFSTIKVSGTSLLATKSSPERPMFTVTVASVNASTTYSTQIQHSALPSSLSSSTTELVITNSVTSSISSSLKSINVTRVSTETYVTLPSNSTQLSIPSLSATVSLHSTLLTPTPSVEISKSRKYTTVVSANVSATRSSQMYSSSAVPVVATSYTAISSALRRSTQEQSKSLTQTPGVEMTQTQNLTATATVTSLNVLATPSTQIRPSTEVPVVSTSYMVLSTSLRSSAPEQSTLLTQISSVDTSQSRRFTVTLASVESGTPSSQIHSSSEVTVVPTSYMAFSSPLTSSTPEQSKSLTQTTSVEMSQSGRFTSINISATPSSQVHSSSYVALSSSPSPSTTEPVMASSAIIKPPGIFVRFGIRVPLGESVNDASFKNNLEKGILEAYENGTLDGMAGNVSVKVS